MIRQHIRRLTVILVTLVAVALALSMTETSVVEAKRRPTPTPTQLPPAPDFLLRYETYSYTDLAYVVKGGLPTCELCFGAWEPRFIDRSGEACFYGSNNFTLTSLNGFEGDVYIGTDALPQGVTSEIPNKVFLPKDQTVLVPFILEATTEVTSRFDLVLVQAIGAGTPTHSIYHEVWFVDQLPPCQ
jgi:hypothetical protein